jgi:hypothetical protein
VQSNAPAPWSAFIADKENHAMTRKTVKPATKQNKAGNRDNRLDTVLGALEKKAPAGNAPRGTCRRFIYCI